MLAWFTEDGTPNPLRFRMENEDKSYTVIKVDKILQKDIEKLAGNNMIIFKCQGNINGIEKIFQINYELRTCKWILFKM